MGTSLCPYSAEAGKDKSELKTCCIFSQISRVFLDRQNAAYQGNEKFFLKFTNLLQFVILTKENQNEDRGLDSLKISQS